MTSDGSRGAGLPYKNIIKKFVPFYFKTMIPAHIHVHTHILTYYGICVCARTHTCWNIIKQLLNSMGDTGLPDIFLIDGTEIKDALFKAETFNCYFSNLGGLDQHWQKKSSFP